MPEWVTAWPREGDIHLRAGVVAARDAEWVTWPGTGLAGRDLGLAEASGGLIAGQHVRANGVPAGEGDWHCYDLDVEFVFLLAGSLGLETLDGQTHQLEPGSSFAHTAFLWHRDLQRSGDLEVVRLSIPNQEQRFEGRDAALPARASSTTPSAVYLSGGEEVGPVVDGWAERDLGTAGLTGGRVRLRVLRIPDHGADTVRPLPAAQWLFVLSGTAEPAGEAGLAPLTAGDSVSTDARTRPESGGRYECSPDFAVLALTLEPSSGEDHPLTR